MSVAVTFMLTAAITMLVLFSFGRDLIATFEQVTGSWTAQESRQELEAKTKISGPTGQWAGADPTVRITLANTGKAAVGRFADWDVIFEIQRSPGLGIAYLTYTTATPPGANQWTVDGIFLDASDLTPETVDPGVLNPNEEMIVLARPDPAVVLDTFDRATFATPNGETASVIFQIIVTPTPTP